jgi:hypothetical protein
MNWFRLHRDATPPASPSPTPTSDEDVAMRLMSYNVYYAKFGASSRTEGVARTISDYRPSVASIQEMWGEKPAILSQIRSKTGLDYAFADGGGNSEKWWDGDILYRADQWRVLDNGVELLMVRVV